MSRDQSERRTDQHRMDGNSSAVADSPEDHLDRSIQFKVNGEYDRAVEELRSVLAVAPENARAHLEMGLVYGFTGLFDESIEELQQAVKLEPSNLGFRTKLGLTYTMLGMYDEAREEFELIVKEGPGTPEADEARKQLRFFEDPDL